MFSSLPTIDIELGRIARPGPQRGCICLKKVPSFFFRRHSGHCGFESRVSTGSRALDTSWAAPWSALISKNNQIYCPAQYKIIIGHLFIGS